MSVLLLSRQHLQVKQQRRLQSARWLASTWQTPCTTPPPTPSPPHGSRLLHVFALLLLPGLVCSAHCLPRGNSPFTSEPPLITTAAPSHQPRVLMHHHSSVPGVHSVRGARLIPCDTALLGGNTAVGKTNKPERARQSGGVFEDRISLKSWVMMATSVVVSRSARCLRLDFHHHFLSFLQAAKAIT